MELLAKVVAKLERLAVLTSGRSHKEVIATARELAVDLQVQHARDRDGIQRAFVAWKSGQADALLLIQYVRLPAVVLHGVAQWLLGTLSWGTFSRGSHEYR